MAKKKDSNIIKGKDSYDIEIDNAIIPFFNRNSTPYPTEVGGVKFDLVPVTKQKDLMINVARMHAQQEYDRIMSLVKVLQEQALQIKKRLEITDMIHAAKYNFQLYHGKIYWLVFDKRKNETILCLNGPNDWNAGPPKEYDYITGVKWLGDYTWITIDEENKHT